MMPIADEEFLFLFGFYGDQVRMRVDFLAVFFRVHPVGGRVVELVA